MERVVHLVHRVLGLAIVGTSAADKIVAVLWVRAPAGSGVEGGHECGWGWGGENLIFKRGIWTNAKGVVDRCEGREGWVDLNIWASVESQERSKYSEGDRVKFIGETASGERSIGPMRRRKRRVLRVFMMRRI